MTLSDSFFRGRRAVLATMHGKEQVIAPALQALGMEIVLADGLDTDVFGTFSGERARPAGQLETARLKCLAALQLTGLDLAIASEGAFGPHPHLPFVPANVEMVLLLDQRNGLEVAGQWLSADTNFAQKAIAHWAEAETFAQSAGFPSHKLILRQGEQLHKGIGEWPQLQALVAQALKAPQPVHLETDMRAMHNPTRMAAIAKACEQLCQRLQSLCPTCQLPGFGLQGHTPGLPCQWCGLPTRLPLAHIYACPHCGHQHEQPVEPAHPADPSYCEFCNP